MPVSRKSPKKTSSKKSPAKKTVSKKSPMKKTSSKKVVSPAERRLRIAKILAALVGTAGVVGGAYKFEKGYKKDKYAGESRSTYLKDLIKNSRKKTTSSVVNLNTVPEFGKFDKNTVYA